MMVKIFQERNNENGFDPLKCRLEGKLLFPRHQKSCLPEGKYASLSQAYHTPVMACPKVLS
jgi:hypothetical protein